MLASKGSSELCWFYCYDYVAKRFFWRNSNNNANKVFIIVLFVWNAQAPRPPSVQSKCDKKWSEASTSHNRHFTLRACFFLWSSTSIESEFDDTRLLCGADNNENGNQGHWINCVCKERTQKKAEMKSKFKVRAKEARTEIGTDGSMVLNWASEWCIVSAGYWSSSI